MLFNSLQFLIFLPLVTALFYLLPHRFRWLMLLAASCAFYMAFIPAYILILFITILIDYFAGIYIAESKNARQKKILLVVSVISTCLVLFVFKYINFFINNINGLAGFLHWNYSVQLLNIILPIGLSFHTFQSLSYVIEVYRGHQKPEKHFGIYALYVMFFPQLVAGPIERPHNLLNQLRKKISFNAYEFSDGLRLILFGFFKKVVVADRMAVIANVVYNNPEQYSGFSVVIATFCFAFQIYGDFSGYTDIARGSAKLLGYNLMINFRLPYFSKSVKEFWQRWHISLSSWFRDYLYISIGGNRKGKNRQLLNTFIVFMVSGLWHGANWTFVIWGSLHGIYVTSGAIFKGFKERVNKFIGWREKSLARKLTDIAITFILVNFAWIFFRANNVDEAFMLIGNIFKSDGNWFSTSFIEKTDSFYISFAMVITMLIIHYLSRHKGFPLWAEELKPHYRYSLYFLLLWTLILFGQFGNQQFIYFQF